MLCIEQDRQNFARTKILPAGFKVLAARGAAQAPLKVVFSKA